MKDIKRIFMIWPSMIIAIVFGMMTMKSGGNVLFIDGPARIEAGNYIGFVVWFNFIAGFFYIITGIGLWIKQPWVKIMSLTIAATTLLVFFAFAIHVLIGGNYEIRTVIAMTLRSVIWILISMAIISYNKSNKTINLN